MKKCKKRLTVLFSLLLLVLTVSCLSVCFTASALGVGDTIQFGNYPQTRVSANNNIKNAANNAIWKSYGYYIGNGQDQTVYDGNMQPDDFMQYADFFCGNVKYRAVRFSKFRPCSTAFESNTLRSYQDDNGYETDVTYYFKYEPLTWRVLDPNEKLVVCESVIDAQPYQNVIREYGFWFYNGSSSQYANNWSKSSIMKWLSTDFCNTAFNAAQKAKIKTSTLDNHAASPEQAQYDSPNTSNKVFLLSYTDLFNDSYGFYSGPNQRNAARRAKGTDYAKCQGLKGSEDGYDDWILRTAGMDALCCCHVDYEGYVLNGYPVGHVNGIRPACRLNDLTSDTSPSYTYTVAASASPAEGGAVTGAGTYSKGETATLKAAANLGWKFVGWYQGEALKNADATYAFSVTDDMALTAKFEKTPITVIFNADGGSVSPESKTVYIGEAYGALPTPTRDGYSFQGWYTYHSETLVTESTVVTNAIVHTLVAHWEEGEPENVCPWCGGEHVGFFQGIIGFFHGIFAKLFGARY